jgi:hypothetical protein
VNHDSQTTDVFTTFRVYEAEEMNKVIRRSRSSTYLITAALLTLFVSGFGVFANIQIEQRNADCNSPVIEAFDSEVCAFKEYLAADLPRE